MQVISEKINNQDVEVTSHILLSIFKMADVEVLRPVANSSNTRFSMNFIQCSLLVYILLQNLIFFNKNAH